MTGASGPRWQVWAVRLHEAWFRNVRNSGCRQTRPERDGIVAQGEAKPGTDGRSVRVQLRLTSPLCQYYFVFKDVLEEQLTTHPQVPHAVVDSVTSFINKGEHVR